MLSTGQVQSILVTGQDHSAEDEIKAELEQVKSLAAETTATLTELTERLEKTRPAVPPLAEDKRRGPQVIR